MSLSSPQEYITIATDISADSDYKIATWACYIRHSGGVIKKSGLFVDYPRTTTHAETHALANALVIAARLPQWKNSHVTIHNEIERVLDPLKNKAGKLAVREIDRTEVILNMMLPILDSAQSWERRKIKAHFRNWKNSPDRNKYYINRWCDEEARRLLRDVREAEILHFGKVQKSKPNKS